MVWSTSAGLKWTLPMAVDYLERVHRDRHANHTKLLWLELGSWARYLRLVSVGWWPWAL
jgi:hypothetical protein